MALRPIRQVVETSNQYHADAAAERGGIVSLASGQVVSYDDATAGSGLVPVGVLLTDVEDLNYFNGPQKLMRSVVDIGGVVAVAVEGEFETDFIEDSVEGTIVTGQTAYLTANGELTNTPTSSNDPAQPNMVVNPIVGVFTSNDHVTRGAGLGWVRFMLQIKQGAAETVS
jgi:hypothetical protein